MTLNKYEVNKLPYHVVGSNNKGRLLSASNSFRSGTPSSCRTSVTEYTNDAFPKRRFKEKNNSPYLYSDRIQLLSRITEKRFIHKKNELFSSFPLANKVYKASSDEFKIIKKNSNQKPKKSVLTLPNVPAPAPQACTVSDMNDSDYGKKSCNRKRSKYGKVSIRSKGFEVYDRDAPHIHLDASSSDFFQKQYNEDGKYSKAAGRREKDISAQDVWTALQNINKFQFRSPPRMTGDTGSPKNKIMYKNRRGKIHNSKRLIETCRTEEIAYVANFEIQSSTSSFDRITVIHNMPKHAKDIKKSILRHQTPARLRFEQRKDPRKSFKPPNERLAIRHNVKCAGLKNNRALMHHVSKIPETKDSVTETDAILSKENLEIVSGRGSIDSSNYFRTESELSTFTDPPKKAAVPAINTEHHTNKNVAHGFKSTPDKQKHTDTISSQQRISNGTTLMETSTERRKPRLVTTMPSAATMPKMTVADIKKRIANLQFPLVILGKEQVSSAFEVPDYEGAQFQGFEKGVWPFMLRWTEKEDYSQKMVARHLSYSQHAEPQSSIPTPRRGYSPPERRRNLATPERQSVVQSERRIFGLLEQQSYTPSDRPNILQSERRPFAPLERQSYTPDRQRISQSERRSFGPLARQSYIPSDKQNISQAERRTFGQLERQSFSPDRQNILQSERRTFGQLERQSFSPPDRQNILQSERRAFGQFERKSFSPPDRQSFSPQDRQNILQSERRTFGLLERQSFSTPDRQPVYQAERRAFGPLERPPYSPIDRQTISDRRAFGPPERQPYAPPERRPFTPLDQQRTIPQSVKQIANKIRRATYNNNDINVIKAPIPGLNKVSNMDSTSKKNLENVRAPITAINVSNKTLNIGGNNKPKVDGNSTAPVKPRPMRQFKDKMLKLLYKKPSTQQVQNEEAIMKDNNEMSVIEIPKRNLPKPVKPENILVRDKQLTQSLRQPPVATTNKHPWSKAKWASDFIDNVMKKIKSGVYYTHFCDNNSTNVVSTTTTARKITSKNSNYSYFGEVSVPTATGKAANVHKGVLVDTESHTLEPRQYESLTYIPGFDDIPLGLEIKSLNFRQISVKHGLSNVVVQFDISSPKGPSIHTISDIDSKSSFIPVSVTESNTKIFKCNTSIINAVLPAELCSVIPKVMRNLFDSNTTIPTSTDTFVTVVSDELSTPISPVFGATRPAKLEGPLSTDKWVQSNPCSPNDLDMCYKLRPFQSRRQPKVYRILNVDQRMPSNPWSHRRAQLTMPTHLPLYEIPTPLMKVLRDGRFSTLELIRSYIFHSGNPMKRVLHRIKLAWSEVRILPKVCVHGLIRAIIEPSRPLSITEVKETFNMPATNSSLQQVAPCNNALEIYTPPSTVFKGFSNLMQNWWKYFRFDIHISLPFLNPLSVTYNNKSQTLNVILGESKREGKTVSFTINNMQKSGVYEQLAKMRLWNEQRRPPTVKCIEYDEKQPSIQNFTTYNSTSNKKSHQAVVVAGPALRTFAKTRENHEKVLLKKKSRTSMYVDKMNTCLNKITSLDEFYQALGVAKFLCGVFDGCSEKKVLSCVGEMKNWVKDISPQQALLVLILTSKRDTPNLIRFRPVLLQGIAVNRITGVTELDMEIEVIEKENLKITQFEGISYLPASQNNQDNLLEELYWIAKTTASDYQRPFDDTSKKLLKNLLYKRKALNPSYLRVMARYVGLGLLKTSLKNIN